MNVWSYLSLKKRRIIARAGQGNKQGGVALGTVPPGDEHSKKGPDPAKNPVPPTTRCGYVVSGVVAYLRLFFGTEGTGKFTYIGLGGGFAVHPANFCGTRTIKTTPGFHTIQRATECAVIVGIQSCCQIDGIDSALNSDTPR